MGRIVRGWLLLTLLFTGCANLEQLAGGDRLAQVDRWLEQGEYGKAQRALTDIAADHPQAAALRERRQRLPGLIATHVAAITDRARGLRQQGQWQPALDTLDSALDRIPDNPQLQQARETLLAARAAQLADWHCQLRQSQGQSLVLETALRRKMVNAKPDDWGARWALQRHLDDVESVADELAQCGARYLQADNAMLAGAYLGLSYQLDPQPATHEQLGRAEQAMNQVRQAQHRNQARAAQVQRQQQQQRLGSLKASYQAALAEGDLPTAQTLMQELLALAGNDPEINRWYLDLQQRVRDRVELGLREGQSLYRRGELERALAVWRETRVLDPDHAELINHIERAERFLNKLDQLKDS